MTTRRRRVIETLAAKRRWIYRRRLRLTALVPDPNPFVLLSRAPTPRPLNVVTAANGSSITVFDCRLPQQALGGSLATVAIVRWTEQAATSFAITERREWWKPPGRSTRDGRFFILASDVNAERAERALGGDLGGFLHRSFRSPVHLELRSGLLLFCRGWICEDNWARFIDDTVAVRACLAALSPQ